MENKNMNDDEILAAAQLANLGRLDGVTWFPNPANKYRVLTFARAILAAQLAAPASEPVPHHFSDWDYCTACGRHADDVLALGVGCRDAAPQGASA